MNLYGLVLPLGIITYILLLMTILTGIRVIKMKVKYHKLFGFLALIAATAHASIIIYLNYLSN